MTSIDLLHCDCIHALRDIPGESIDLIVTDPPYLVNYSTAWRADADHKFRQKIKNDKNPALLADYIPQLYRVLKDDCAMYMFGRIDKLGIFTQHIETAGFKIKNHIVWDKCNHTVGDLSGALGYQYELVILAVKGSPRIRGKRYSDLWRFPRVPAQSLIHQNQKPVELIARFITSFSDVGHMVLDPFAGSGTTAIACIDTGRNFIGYEIDDYYFDIAEKRIAERQNQIEWRFS